MGTAGDSVSSRASNSSSVGLMTTGLGIRSSSGFLGLQAVAGDAEDDRLVAVDPPLFDQLLGDGQGDAAGGLGPDPLGLGQELHGVDDRLVVDVLAPAAGRPDQLRGEVAVGRVADGQALGDRLRVADRLDLARRRS